MRKKYIVLLAGILIATGSICFGLFAGKSIAGQPSGNIDIAGTTYGTTTFPVLSFAAATSTYVYRIGADTDTATFKIGVTSSTAAGNIQLYIQASDDVSCNTTATTATDATTVLKKQIRWFGLNPSHYGLPAGILTAAGNLANSSSTPTFSWPVSIIGSGSPESGVEVTLTDLNTECLRFAIGGYRVDYFAQLRTKIKP